MDDIEYAGSASTQKLTSNEEDNRAAQARYSQDILANVAKRTASKKPDTLGLTRERFPEEN